MTRITTSPLAGARYPSPLGALALVASTTGLRAVLWAGDDPRRAGLPAAPLEPTDNDVLAETALQLDEYFAGSRRSFELPLELEGTPFQLAAWRALAEIPYGETRTYAEQAARLGRPRAFRAVGAANGRNPLSIVLPCHRVVGSDGSLTGFAAGLDAKRRLLDHERAVVGAGPVAIDGRPERAPGAAPPTGRPFRQVPCPGPVALGGEAAVP